MFIIVYLGALMMLFVFVVMLFSAQQNKIEVTPYKLFGFLIFSLFAYKTALTLYISCVSNTTISFVEAFNQLDL
jgi:NADH:ubiquinone oxidoreductase subunit 6 (subunit J)